MKLKSKISSLNAGKHISDAVNRAEYGRVVSSRFFKRNFFAVAFTVGLVMIYISNRYDCITGMETINALRTELDITKTELQSEKSAYMSSTRESAMMTLVDTLHLGLDIQERPPYTLSYITPRHED